MRAYNLRYIFLSFFSILTLAAYPGDDGPFRFQGHTGLYYDFYDHYQQNYNQFRPRYPSNFGRFSAHATLSAGKHFSMPLGIDLTMGQATYHLPQIPEENLIDYVRNPRNNIQVNPTYKWASAWLGTQTPSFSELTAGDVPIFGAGVELKPRQLYFFSPLRHIADCYQCRPF